MPGIKKIISFRKIQSFVNRKFIKMTTVLIFMSTPNKLIKLKAHFPKKMLKVVKFFYIDNVAWAIHTYEIG